MHHTTTVTIWGMALIAGALLWAAPSPGVAKDKPTPPAEAARQAVRDARTGDSPVVGAPVTRIGAARGACQATARASWRTGQTRYSLEAASQGPTCLTAVSTLVIRDSSGGVVWADIFVNEQNFALQDADTPAKLAAALGQWIDQRDSGMATTQDLPAWGADQDLPATGEFPFYVEESFGTQKSYQALRTRAAPMICYVQGIESLGCIALVDGGFIKVGAQSFPG